MKPSRLYLSTLLLCAANLFAAEPLFLTIPSMSGPLTIDGKLDEPAWQSIPIFALTSTDFGAPFPAGGEARVATCGSWLCLSARVPEPARVVAHSSGRNPNWWSEDLVTWNVRVRDTVGRRQLNLSLTVNPAGAYRVLGAAGIDSIERAEKLPIATHLAAEEWTVEAAIPLDRLGQIGFIDVLRVRAARPDAPELRWYWPVANERATFQFATISSGSSPEFHPTESSAAKPASPASPLDWIPKNAWTDEKRNTLQASQSTFKYLRSQMGAIAEQERREWETVNSREAWERFRDRRLAALRKWMGPLPERTPLRPVVTRRANYGDGFVIENVVYESRPNLLVTANLYLPENPSGKIPAIVMVHSHHNPKTQSELQDLGMTWARSGTAVLVMDQLCAGERSQSQPWPRESYYGRYTLNNQLLLAGESLSKWMIWDLMRGIDLLTERSYIDPQRIIMLGAVAGGGDPAALIAALDLRIAAVIPFNFGEAGPEEHYTYGPRGYAFDTAWPGWGEWEISRCLPRSVADQFFPWFLCAAVAPRPFLYSFEIGWPEDVEHEPMWARYKKVYGFYGARDRLDEVHGFGPYPGPGECNNVGTFLRQRIHPILKRWLNVTTPAAEYHNPRPDSELMALTSAVASERQPKTASAIALGLARQRLAGSRARTSLGELRRALEEKLGDVQPAHPAMLSLWTKSDAKLTVEALIIETSPGIELPVYLLEPLHPAVKPMPVVLGIAQGGKAQFLSASGQEVATLLEKGFAVCLPDLRDIGEVAFNPSRGPGGMDLAASQFMLGGTLLGARVKDIRTIIHYLASRPDIDPAGISLWGESFAETNAEDFVFDQSEMQESGPFAQHRAEPMGALLALLTGLYEDRVKAIVARGGLVSFLSVLEDRFSQVPQDVIVPGILEVADVADIVAAQNWRPVPLERFVDGRNKIARHAAWKASPKLLVRESEGGPEIVSWLAGQSIRRSK